MGFRLRAKTLVMGVGVVFLVLVGGIVSAAPPKDDGLEHIPDVLVSFAPEKGNEYAVIVEMSTQTLFLYGFDGRFKTVYRMRCSTGEVPGAKSRSGDKKTPEGVYFFIKEHEEKDLSPIYGSRAYPMDYPNLMDRIAARDGNSIWMHGTNKPLKPRDSNGCIALENKNIDKLSKFITLNRTPIIVTDTLNYIPVSKTIEISQAVHDFLSQWRLAMENGTYHEYLMFYDQGYIPDISWWLDWIHIKKGTGAVSATLSVDLKKVMILKHRDIYVALFDQTVKSLQQESYAGTRKLFFKNINGQFKIVGDVYQASPGNQPKGLEKANPLVAAGHIVSRQPEVVASKKIEKIPRQDVDIQNLIEGWLSAWSSKDIKKYGSYYAKNFKSQGGASLQSWLDYKNRLNRKYDYIKVSQRNLVVQNRSGRRIATFVQNYDSNRLKTVGTKQLVFVREDGQWKIYREIWKKK